MMGIQQGASPTRLLEMLSDRFGAFEALANSSIKVAVPLFGWARLLFALLDASSVIGL